MDVEKEIEELKKRVEFLERQNRERLSGEIEKLKSETAWIDYNKKLNERLTELSNGIKEKIKWNG